MPRYLFLPRIQRCTPYPAACAVCREITLTFLFDCDLLSRVCLFCGEVGGVVEIELRAAGCVAPNHQLCKANP